MPQEVKKAPPVPHLEQTVIPLPPAVHPLFISTCYPEPARRRSPFRVHIARLAAAPACLFVPQRARGLKILCESNITPTPPSLVYMPMVQAAG